MMDMTSTYTLNNGYQVPVVGFGTIIPDGKETVMAVKDAIKSGYRLIDTAEIYGNEVSVGQGIREALAENNLKREDILVSTKAWHSHRGYAQTLQAFNVSLDKLGLDYVDIYLIHWPANAKWHDDWRELNADTWRALEELYRAGKIKAIGVSNFLEHHLKAFVEDSAIKPKVKAFSLSDLDDANNFTNISYHDKLVKYRDQGKARKGEDFNPSQGPIDT